MPHAYHEKEIMRAYLSDMGIDLDKICLLVYGIEDSSSTEKNILRKVVCQIKDTFRKPYYFIFSDEKIIVKNLVKHKSYTIYKDCLKSFRIKKDEEDNTIIKFEYNNEPYTFYCYNKYKQDNLSILKENNWFGFLKDKR